MELSSVDIRLSTVSAVATSSAVKPAAADGATDSVRRSHGEHRGQRSEFMSALQQALGDSGLAMPRRSEGRHRGESSDDDGHEGKHGNSAARAVRHDLHRLVHDLFAAVRDSQNGAAASTQTTGGDASPAPAAGTTSATQAKSGYDGFASALQGLIQQLQGGNSASGNSALARLQSDFNKLVSDIGRLSGDQGTPGQQQSVNINITINIGAASSASTGGQGASADAAASGSQAASGSNGGASATSQAQNAPNLQNFLENLVKRLQGLSAGGHSLIGTAINETV